MADLTKAQVAQKVREYTAGRDVDGVTLEVLEDEIVHVNGWCRVPVRPSAWTKRISTDYEALADIEATIDENEGLNILLSSGQPADVEAVAG